MATPPKFISQHKHLAHGADLSTHKAYATGGVVASTIPAIAVRVGKAVNPLTQAKRNNGIPGFVKGGKVCK